MPQPKRRRVSPERVARMQHDQVKKAIQGMEALRVARHEAFNAIVRRVYGIP